MTPHIVEQIETYLAQGLSPEEAGELEAHIAECGDCRAALDLARAADEQLQSVFADQQPREGFEHWLVKKLPSKRRWIHPMVFRAGLAAAAVAGIASIGVGVSQGLNPESRIRAASNLKQIGLAMAYPRTYWNGTGTDAGNPPAPPKRPFDQFDGYMRPTFSDPSGPAGQSHATALSGANSYAGATVVSGGTLAWAAGDGGLTKTGAGTLQLGSTTNGAVNQPAAFRPPEQLTLDQAAQALDTNGTSSTWGTNAAIPSSGTTANPPEGANSASRFYKIAKTQDLSASLWTVQTDGDGIADQGVINLKPQPANGLTYYAAVKVVDGKDNAGSAAMPLVEGKPIAPVRENDGKSDVPQPSKPVDGNRIQKQAPDSPQPAAQQNLPAISRKVIRNGTMEFEVDRFDDAVMRITKLVDEQQGFVATTDSDKLANGKMRGTITLRVPPERLDTLVLTLRGLGDLKSQKITAEDVTKHYTDLESELRAARAMEERLLEIIKSGTGQIKDLLAAEKELGVWRGKIETIEGEKRYLDNLVGLSTLVLTLVEKDIQQQASSTESEQVTMSLETESVDAAYDKALEAIKSAKGRVLASELKQFDAGQFGGMIRAAIPPDAAEEVVARLRQLDGRIAHFNRQQKQLIQDAATVPVDALRVKREDTIVDLQIYNLANVAPRRSTRIVVAVNEVDKTYQQIIDQVRSAGGRVVTSAMTKPDASSQSAELDLQFPSEKADTLIDSVHLMGEVMRQESSESADTANVTEAKRGLKLSILSLSATPPRETQTMQLAATNVPQAFNDILNAVRTSEGRVLQSDLSEQNPQEVTGTIAFEIPRSAATAMDKLLDKSGQVMSRVINRSANTENTVDTKVRLQMTLFSAERLTPRQTTTIREEVENVERCADDVVAAAVSAGGRRVGTGDLSQDRSGNVTAQVVVEVPFDKAGPILDQAERMGNRRSKQVAFDPSVRVGPLSLARIDVTFSNSAASLGGEETTWDAVRNGLSVSGRGLRWSLQMLVVGFCFVAPWALAIWGIYRMLRRKKTSVGT